MEIWYIKYKEIRDIKNESTVWFVSPTCFKYTYVQFTIK
jgi:hypothetical protein